MILAKDYQYQINRIRHPENFETNIFKCDNCSQLIGVLINYEKENRAAFHLEQGSFIIKKLYQGKKLKEPK